MNKNIKIFLCLFLTIFFAGAYAKSSDDTSCDNLAGRWMGKAEIKYFLFTCTYDSVAHIDESAFDDASATAEVTVTKTSGMFLCPSSTSHDVVVSCNHGKVSMKDTSIDVEGYMNEEGTAATLEGNYYVTFRYHPFKLFVTKAG